MKNKFIRQSLLFCCFLVSSTSLFSQYKIDLKTARPTPLKYLKMGNPGPAGKEIKVNNLYMETGGIPQLPVMGEFHYNRLDHRYWKDALLKMKSTGVDIVSTYILWVLHEEFEGRQDWTGRNDLRQFVKLCGEVGLKVHLRIGPYCNAEIRNGGFPDWMEFNKNFRCRTNDPLYLEYVKYWYDSVYNQISDLQYKDNGPIIAVQLENEYVTPGLVIPHMTKLKEIAVSIGYDLPIYSMTHWMMSDYPKGEIIPYAGYYMETPWVYNNGKKNETTSQEFFSYNRISDNIGNDFIKIEGEVESLTSEDNESPYFTCENGLGAPTYYQHRGVVPEKTAGENINLRLGCGVNLMGYYVYVGQTNPIGERYVLHRATARISNDYQAPIKEFGTMGTVMCETKKINYFMNDFGSDMAPLTAYLPNSNKDTANLQWAVRTDGEKGYLFCSNYLHKHNRKDYRNVQFNIELNNETIKIPRKKTTIKNGGFFFWPFNHEYADIKIKYATVQPICKHVESGVTTFFFFADDQIDGEYLINKENISKLSVTNGHQEKEGSYIRIEKLSPGKDCVIEITKDNGEKVKLITLTEPESDNIWKGKNKGKDYVILTESTVIAESGEIKLLSENANQSAFIYAPEGFTYKTFTTKEEPLQAKVTPLVPMQEAKWIAPVSGKILQRCLDATSLSKVEKAILRLYAPGKVEVKLNDTNVKFTDYNEYLYSDVSNILKNNLNHILFQLDQPEKGMIAEMEVLLENGTRWIFNTDHLWYGENGGVVTKEPANNQRPTHYAYEEHLSTFLVDLPAITDPAVPVRMYLNFNGDIGNAYIGNQLIHDRFNNGADWIIGLNRYTHLLNGGKLVLRLDGLKSPDAPIYFEEGISKEVYTKPSINNVDIRKEYVITLK